MRRGPTSKLRVADRGDFMERESRIFRFQIDDSLPHGRRETPLIQFGHFWWEVWGQETCHPCLIKEIGLVIDGSLGHACFRGPLLRGFPTQDDSANELRGYLSVVLQQATNLLRFMRVLMAVKSLPGH